MKWLSNCINRLYSSSCTNELATPASMLPPMDIQELSPVVAINCKGCIKPCAQHPVVPPHLNIDQSKPLHNTVPPYAIHIIIMTGQTDWPAHIEDQGLAQSLIEAIRRRKNLDHRAFETRYHPAYFGNTTVSAEENQRVIVTNSSLPSTHSTLSRAQDIILLPDSIIISNVTSKRVDALLDYVFGKPCFQAFSTYPCPFASLILVCGHGSKDRRCGTVGPMLQNALKQAAAKEEEGGTTQVALVSHLGGKCSKVVSLGEKRVFF